MQTDTTSGQEPFIFVHREDLSNLPSDAKKHEANLHGGFAINTHDGSDIYYGMPGCGIMRVDTDLQKQEIISLPNNLKPINFHSTVIGQFDGKNRLILSANNDEMVVVLTLDGEIDFVLPRPVFAEYQTGNSDYKPTDTILVGDQLYIADGYGSNYITSANIRTREWTGIFGGKTENSEENGKFATAHGINLNPTHDHIDIADRPHSRIQVHTKKGSFHATHKLPAGAFLCGIGYLEYNDRWYAVIGCLNDPEKNRPAPIYIIDAESYELLSVIRPKEDFGIDFAQHIHNAALHIHNHHVYLVCQSWNPGHYFVLEKV